jgi:hypothetical protein
MGGDYPAINSVVLNALQCEPKWQTDGNGNLIHLAPPTSPNKIDIYLDPDSLSGAASALDAAIGGWNPQLTGTGIELRRVNSPCGTGPGCVTVQSASLGGCGFTPPVSTDSTGQIVGNIFLQIRANWSTFTPDSLQRTLAHEIGHLLGLANYDATEACDTTGNSAVMQENFTCGPDSSPSVNVTINDYLPVKNTVYGGNTRNTCGF